MPKMDKMDKGRKRTREGSSQTDEEDAAELHQHGCQKCSEATNVKLSKIEEKLNKLLESLPDLEKCKSKVKALEDENKNLKQSIEYAQTDIEKLQTKLVETCSLQEAATCELKRVNAQTNEVYRRHIKLECHSRRNNLKFFGIQEEGKESNSDTEETLREFLRNKLKIPPSDEGKIQFERVHRIVTRTASANQAKSRPRPIIAKLTYFQDKDYIKSFIKNLSKGSKYGISDDFPKEVDQIRKKLYPVLKSAKQEKKEAFFNVERLIINGVLYRGAETQSFPLYGHLMDS